MAYALFWDGRKLKSSVEEPLSYDTETELIGDKATTPKLVLATGYDGEYNCVIGPHQIEDFFKVHKDSYFVGHNWAYDFWTTHEHVNDSEVREILWNAAAENRCGDSMLLDQLYWLSIGKGESNKSEGDGSKFFRRGLDAVVKEYLGVKVDKKVGDEKGEYRLRFAELLNVPVEKWATDVDPGFFEYATTDTKVTYDVYKVMRKLALDLQKEFLPAASETKFSMYHDAVERFGVLTEAIQVKASIALAKISQNGLKVDKGKAAILEEKIRKECEEFIPFLEQHFPHLLQPFKKKEGYKVAEKSGIPCLKNKEIQKLFEEWYPEMGLDAPIKSKGKKGGTSVSVKDWSPFKEVKWSTFQEKNEFVKRWVNARTLSKRLSFFDLFRHGDLLHPNYNVLVRTGRTSCSEPNTQQMPRQQEFRECFVPRGDNHMVTADYAAIELRTLGTICLFKFGFSVLLDTVKKGVDPHAYTAAMFEGMSLDAFMALKDTDPKRFKDGRQAAKACNFGVPGGLGKVKLSEYAKANYGVAMSPDQAETFRVKLITEVYPELKLYLASNDVDELARNLKVDASTLFDFIFESYGEPGMICYCLQQVLDGKPVKKDGTPYKPYFVSQMWKLAEELLSMSPHPLKAPFLKDAQGKVPGWKLVKFLFGGTAVTLTGRIRKGVKFTERKNTSFQGLAADGGKLALFEMVRRGMLCVGWVHDEALTEVTDPCDAKLVEEIMVQEMEAVLNNAVPVAVEYKVGDSWNK